MNIDNWRVKRDPSEVPARDPREKGSFQQNANTTDRSSQYEPRQSFGRSTNSGPPRDTFRKPYDDSKADAAINEGRRLYVGNMPYEATVKDVETLFKDLTIESINMSVDPMTGRNPSYCFVDFPSKEIAQTVMEEYNGRDFLRRPLRVKPGLKSGTGSGRFDLRPKQKDEGTQAPFDRWRRWETPEQLAVASQEGRRLYVGGLPRFRNQDDTSTQIRELFASNGFEVEVISKLVSPHETKRDEPGNHNFCFVDVGSTEIAEAAIAALNGLEKWDWKIKVSKASGTSKKLGERKRLYVGGLPEFTGPEATEESVRELFAGYEVKTVSRLFPPRQERMDEEGNHYYCFVELSDEEQTDSAVEALDWKEMWGWKVRVKHAFSGNAKQTDRPAPRGWGQSR